LSAAALPDLQIKVEGRAAEVDETVVVVVTAADWLLSAHCTSASSNDSDRGAPETDEAAQAGEGEAEQPAERCERGFGASEGVVAALNGSSVALAAIPSLKCQCARSSGGGFYIARTSPNICSWQAQHQDLERGVHVALLKTNETNMCSGINLGTKND